MRGRVRTEVVLGGGKCPGRGQMSYIQQDHRGRPLKDVAVASSSSIAVNGVADRRNETPVGAVVDEVPVSKTLLHDSDWTVYIVRPCYSN